MKSQLDWYPIFWGLTPQLGHEYTICGPPAWPSFILNPDEDAASHPVRNPHHGEGALERKPVDPKAYGLRPFGNGSLVPLLF